MSEAAPTSVATPREKQNNTAVADADVGAAVAADSASDKSQDGAVQLSKEIDNMSMARVTVIWLSVVCGVMCTFLDEGIIATAIPQITDEFRSLGDVGWYGSAYLLTLCAFQLVYGRLYSQFPIKVIYLASLAVFETGSLICAVSKSSTAFIVGRSISGLGGSGLMSGTIALFASALPSSRLPLYLGSVGVVYGLASVLGPVVGGLITNSHLTWRWCFYINLPLSVPPAICTAFFVKVRPSETVDARSWMRKALALDYLGMLLLVPSITCLILALQLGGTQYGWADGKTIGCFVVFAVLLVAFVTEQWWMDEKALVPPRVFRMRVVFSAAMFGFCLESAFLVLVYYIPLWFQAIQGVTAEQSGIRYLPLCLAFILAIFSSGWLVTKLGYFQPFMLAGTVLVSLGSGLLSTLRVSSGSNLWIPFQIIAGLGIGASTEQPSVATQSLLAEADAPIGVAVVLFCQNLGPATFISVANTIFARTLSTEIERRLPGLDPAIIRDSGATALHSKVAPDEVGVLLELYNEALTRTFLVAAVLAAASIVGLVGIGMQRIPTSKDDGPGDEEPATAEPSSTGPAEKCGQSDGEGAKH
ncbi:major facilitator superfamily transporter [Drechmeria coniospora]|uniref:Major facilitator superfamily transporter n=1 Tax=Drechmeria coniospora TaxID=98403 RepID=A0A151GBC2_DRECN|nr:major facilitator superfamily transporter [Drechmeria coniospora]KYK54409.1 major facilitator superfamily transporter [Drechmeria coniospora]ODA77308.1 hypothetical protein RJ55_06935 [Drechmeria coniospora]